MFRLFAFLFLLSSACHAQEFADGFDHGSCQVIQRHNLAVTIGPPEGGSNLKLRMAIEALPVRKGEPLVGALVGLGGVLPYVYSIAAGSLPPGISLNSTTGILSGTPTTVGRYTFLAQVQDPTLAVFKCTLAIEVIPALSVVHGTPTDAALDHEYSYQFEISGALGSVSYASTGTLPAGLSLTPDGELHGIASSVVTTTYNFTVIATDAGSGDSLEIPCHMTSWRSLISLAGVSIQTTVGVDFTAAVSPIGGRPPYVYTLDGVPANLILSVDLAGTITGRATQAIGTTASPESFSVFIQDTLGTVLEQVCYIVALNANQVLQPQNAGLDVGIVGAYKLNFSSDFNVANDGETMDVSLAGGGSSLTGDGVTVGINSGGEIFVEPTFIDSYTTKTTPVSADEFPLADSAAGFVAKKVTWANIKATLKTYFDTLYVSVTGAVTSVFGRTGAVTAQNGDYTPTQVGLGNVTNDTQTKSAIVPNTAPSAGQILVGNAGGTAYAPVSMSGGATMTSAGVVTLTAASTSVAGSLAANDFNALAALQQAALGGI